ncbi:hypothetical protein HPB47_021247, partial [Ixodes persulcatus]
MSRPRKRFLVSAFITAGSFSFSANGCNAYFVTTERTPTGRSLFSLIPTSGDPDVPATSGRTDNQTPAFTPAPVAAVAVRLPPGPAAEDRGLRTHSLAATTLRRTRGLRRMKQLLGERASTIDDALLQELFLERLPPNVQMVLAAAAPLNFTRLAGLAEAVMEVSTPSTSNIAATTIPPASDAPSTAQNVQIPNASANVWNKCYSLQQAVETQRALQAVDGTLHRADLKTTARAETTLPVCVTTTGASVPTRAAASAPARGRKTGRPTARGDERHSPYLPGQIIVAQGCQRKSCPWNAGGGVALRENPLPPPGAVRERSHSEADPYHKAAVLFASNFLQAVEGELIHEQLYSANRRERDKNRKKLLSIIDVVLPGTRTNQLKTMGTFVRRALLRMKVQGGDEVLREHIESGPGNATHLSPQIQNEIIAASGRIIQDTIPGKLMAIPKRVLTRVPLLQILATMPVSTAEAERSFSTFQRLKSYLRASTSQQRLLELALLNVHREVHISPERVLSLLSVDRRRLRLN